VHYNAVFGGGKKIGKHLNAETQRRRGAEKRFEERRERGKTQRKLR